MSLKFDIFCYYGVNFINVLQAAFVCADPKRAKKTDNLTVFFALLGSESIKAARRTLIKLTHGQDKIASISSIANKQLFIQFSIK